MRKRLKEVFGVDSEVPPKDLNSWSARDQSWFQSFAHPDDLGVWYRGSLVKHMSKRLAIWLWQKRSLQSERLTEFEVQSLIRIDDPA